MADDDSSPRLLLIVTGSTLRAEESDRPLAYYLQQRVAAVAEGLDLSFRTVVLADFRWMNDDNLQVLPTISLGGPGVNALAHKWFDEVPFALAVDEQYCLQMDPDLDEPRASIWGMDNSTTQIAVSVFVDRYLSRFLENAASYIPETVDPDESDE